MNAVYSYTFADSGLPFVSLCLGAFVFISSNRDRPGQTVALAHGSAVCSLTGPSRPEGNGGSAAFQCFQVVNLCRFMARLPVANA